MLTPQVDQTLYEVQSVLVTLVLIGCALGWLVRRLQRSRPDFSIGRAVAVGVAVRALVAIAVGAISSDIRGPDEKFFLDEAQTIAEQSLTSTASIEAFTSTLQIWLFSVQMRFADVPELSMRMVQIGIAVAGLTLLATAVYDLAGAHAAKLAAWIVMLEPTNVFFSGFLHKEPLMLFGVGLVVFGGTKIWSGRDLHGFMLLGFGGAFTVATRPYAGWFVVAAAAAISLHGAVVRRGWVQRPSLHVAVVVVLLVAAAAPKALQETSDDRIQEVLVPSQEANTSDNSNLKLEEVDYSNRGAVILNLPRRVVDVLVRPYPWELGSANQRLGVPGALVALIALFLLVKTILANRGQIFRRAGPIVYAGLFLLVAYSVASANAGTSFRYRTTLVTLAICAIAIWREPSPVAGPKKDRPAPGVEPGRVPKRELEKAGMAISGRPRTSPRLEAG